MSKDEILKKYERALRQKAEAEITIKILLLGTKLRADPVAEVGEIAHETPPDFVSKKHCSRLEAAKYLGKSLRQIDTLLKNNRIEFQQERPGGKVELLVVDVIHEKTSQEREENLDGDGGIFLSPNEIDARKNAIRRR